MECNQPILSLFSGAGGLDLGFLNAGFKPLLAIDADAAAVATYHRNLPGVRVEKRDISQLSDTSLIALWEETCARSPVGIIGGPPCQTFSIGNRNIRSDDVRRSLPAHYARLLAALNRRYALRFFVFENVNGLKSSLHRSDYARFLSLFEDAGFRLFEAALDAEHFGVAQQRVRLLVVGLNAQQFDGADFEFPERPVPNALRTVRNEIEGLPEPAYYRRGMERSEIPLHPNHWTMVPRSVKFLDPNQRLNWSRGRSFRVLQWDAPSWTVAYGHREVHVHPEGHRRLSVYEAMRLQGFPSSYVLEGTLSDQFRLVCDAVPPPLAAAVANAVAVFLARQPPTVEAALR